MSAARHIQTGEIVALKKVRFDRSREGVPVTSVRELAVLQKSHHPNIVKLQKVVTGARADRQVAFFPCWPVIDVYMLYNVGISDVQRWIP